MSLRAGKRRRISFSRAARFEQLEVRDYLAANLAITADPDVQQMPSVAVNPLDPDHVVVAYMDYSLVDTGYAGIGVRVSIDGGTTWGAPSKVPVPADFAQGAANPVVKFDNVDHDDNPNNGVQNRVYVSFMAATFLGGEKPQITNPGGGPPRALGFQSNNGIFVSHSDDGGSNWKAPTFVASNRNDGNGQVPVSFEINPDLAVDTTIGSKYFGHVYVTWARYYGPGLFPGEAGVSSGGSQVMLAVSTDGGKNFSTQLQERPGTKTMETVIVDAFDSGDGVPPGAGAANWSHVAIGPNGDVYVSIFYLNEFRVYHSSDGGTSFTLPSAAEPPRGLPFGAKPVSPTPSGYPSLDFRLLVSRAIAADPTRPGTVYAAEAYDLDVDSTIYDIGDIVFSRSGDNGKTWTPTFKLGANEGADFLNDDNGGERARLDNLREDLTGGQVMPRLVTDAKGRVAVIWYDSRRDPANRLLDVFATVSTDGGKSFKSNFRITDQSFDADLGRFTNALGEEDFAYFGDAIGLALADDAMYAAWTDTRDGSQDIYFSRISVDPVPLPPNDRFESNDTLATAIKVGPDPVLDVHLPRLTLVPGEEDWFKVVPPISQLTVTAEALVGADKIKFELLDADGQRVAESVPLLSGEVVVGQQILNARVTSDQTYFVRVLSTADAVLPSDGIGYSLTLATLTANLGQLVHQVVDGSLDDGSEAYYLLTSKVAGAVEVALTVADGFQGSPTVELMDLRKPDRVLAQGSGESPRATVRVDAGQQLLVHLMAGSLADGAYQLELTNFDQFSLSDEEDSKLFFPAGAGPSEVAIANLNDDSIPDLVVSSALSNFVNVLIGNGDGTFQAPRQFAVGAFNPLNHKTPLLGRAVAVADVDRDGHSDIIVTNYASSDVSVLLGRGDGTFQPQRRFDATAAPFALATGELNGDKFPDLVVVDSAPKGEGKFAVLLGRSIENGWGFQPPQLFDSPLTDDFSSARVKIADLNNDGLNDLLIGSDFDPTTHVLLGNGNGTFRSGQDYVSFTSGLALADLNGDHYLDVVNAQLAALDKVSYVLNKGDGLGAFESQTQLTAGISPIAVAVTDFDGDKVLDLIAVNSGITQPLIFGPPTIMLLRGLVDGSGQFVGFDDAETLATLKYPHDIQVADLNVDGAPDIVVVDRDGIVAIFGRPPSIDANDTPSTARDLGTVVHVVEPTLTIVPGHTDAYYTLTVPTEAFDPNAEQVLDFSAGFANEGGAGLMMEVGKIDANGVFHPINPADRGDPGHTRSRFRIRARQGEELAVHIFGQVDGQGERGTGAFTLVINTLPQVAAVEAHSLLPGQGDQPGGPTTSIVLVLQGSRPDAEAAEDPENYTVTWLGPDGVKRGGDDQVINVGVGLPDDSKSVIYDPSRNIVDAASGRTFPTAVRQTVTLLFGQPLPAGNYEIEVSADVVSAAFNLDELGLLSPREDFHDHSLVSIVNGAVVEGAITTEQNFVLPPTAVGNLSVFEDGTSFLTQFYHDLSAFLDALLTALGDDAAITDQLLQQVVDRFGPALGPIGAILDTLTVVLIDPTSFGVVDPDGRSFGYDLQTSSIVGRLPQAFIEVGGNIEVVVIPNSSGSYQLSLADIPARARGGVVHFSRQGVDVRSFTSALRAGTLNFVLNVGGFQLTAGLVTSITTQMTFRAMLGAAMSSTQLSFVPPTRASIQPVSSRPTLSSAVARPASLIEFVKDSAIAAFRVPATPAFGGGSSVPTNWLGSLKEVWDEVFSTWNGEERDALGNTDSDDGGSDDEASEFSPMQRVWDAMMDTMEDLFQADSKQAQSAEDQAASADNSRSGDSANQGQTSQDSKNDADQAAASQTDDRRQSGTTQGATEPISQATDVTPAPQSPSVEATSLVEDPPHATAA